MPHEESIARNGSIAFFIVFETYDDVVLFHVAGWDVGFPTVGHGGVGGGGMGEGWRGLGPSLLGVGLEGRGWIKCLNRCRCGGLSTESSAVVVFKIGGCWGRRGERLGGKGGERLGGDCGRG